MVYQGPNNPSTFDQEGPGTSWTNPSNVQTQNNIYATISVDNTVVVKSLRAMNYGFSVPTTATINGIEVFVERQAQVTSRITDSTVYLIKGSTTQAVNKADTVTFWADQDVIAIYGAPSDLWSTTWTPAEINSTGFGVAFRPQQTVDSTPVTAYVDWIGVVVYYTDVDTGVGVGNLVKRQSQFLKFGDRLLRWRK